MHMTSTHLHAIKAAKTAATRAHRGQFRKDGRTPYITHPERVAKRVKFFGGNHIAIIAAWLHDVMEDCDGGEQIVKETLAELPLPQAEQHTCRSRRQSVTRSSRSSRRSPRIQPQKTRRRSSPTHWTASIMPRHKPCSSSSVTGWRTSSMQRTSPRSFTRSISRSRIC